MNKAESDLLKRILIALQETEAMRDETTADDWVSYRGFTNGTHIEMRNRGNNHTLYIAHRNDMNGGEAEVDAYALFSELASQAGLRVKASSAAMFPPDMNDDELTLPATSEVLSYIPYDEKEVDKFQGKKVSAMSINATGNALYSLIDAAQRMLTPTTHVTAQSFGKRTAAISK